MDAAAPRWRRWRYRVDLVSHLAGRELRLWYPGSTLGVVWFLAVLLA